jgi:3-oxoacyl-[acyl-carrier protein] reductase
VQIQGLAGKVIVVTGAARGIGAQVARRLLEADATVVALVHSNEPHPDSQTGLHALPASLQERLTVVVADVCDTASVAAAAGVVARRHGRVDALVNNAGVIEPIGLIGDIDPDRWGHVLAVNATGALRCTQVFLPQLLDSRGTIVNLCSGAAYRPLEGWSAYCASKAALVMISRATDLEYSSRGLKVFALGVAPTDTGMQTLIRASGVNPISRIPQGELSSPTSIAAAIAWLCSPAAHALEQTELDVREPLFADFFKGST